MNRSVLINALLLFAAIKLLFSCVGWLTKDAEDHALRRHLDRLFDALDSRPLLESTRAFLRRFLNRWESTFHNTNAARVRFILLSWGINAGLMLAALTQEHHRIREADTWMYVAIYSIVALAPDVLVAKASLVLLRRAIATKRFARLATVLCVDLILLYLATVLNYALTNSLTFLYGVGTIDRQAMIMALAAFTATVEVMCVHIWRFPHVLLTPLTWLTFVGASIQTSMYISLALFLLALRLIPRGVQHLLARIVFRLTTDESPLFSQLGTAVGAVGGVLTAIITAIRAR